MRMFNLSMEDAIDLSSFARTIDADSWSITWPVGANQPIIGFGPGREVYNLWDLLERIRSGDV